VSSAPPETMLVPSGLTATACTASVWPVSGALGIPHVPERPEAQRRRVPESRSQSRSVMSWLVPLVKKTFAGVVLAALAIASPAAPAHADFAAAGGALARVVAADALAGGIVVVIDGTNLSRHTAGTMKYTNTNYIVAGLLIQSVTGRPAAEEITRRILVPLGLSHSYFPAPGDTGLAVPFAYGYQVIDGQRRDVTQFNASLAGMSGELITTNEDTAAFITALLDGRVVPPHSSPR